MKSLNNYQRTLVKLAFIVICLLTVTLSMGQTAEPQYKIVGNEIVKTDKMKVSKAVKTKLIHKVKDSVYTVWKSQRGSYYIWRTSKKTKKKYKQYLKVK